MTFQSFPVILLVAVHFCGRKFEPYGFHFFTKCKKFSFFCILFIWNIKNTEFWNYFFLRKFVLHHRRFTLIFLHSEVFTHSHFYKSPKDEPDDS